MILLHPFRATQKTGPIPVAMTGQRTPVLTLARLRKVVVMLSRAQSIFTGRGFRAVRSECRLTNLLKPFPAAQGNALAMGSMRRL